MLAADYSYGEAAALRLQSSRYAAVALMPGDSRSIDVEYDGLLWKTGVFNLCSITALIPDEEIHYLSITFTPQCEAGAEIGFFTLGGFIYGTAGSFKFNQFLEPRLSYGSENIEYIITVYPAVSIGIVFSAVAIEYFDFDYPFKLTLTATLSK